MTTRSKLDGWQSWLPKFSNIGLVQSNQDQCYSKFMLFVYFVYVHLCSRSQIFKMWMCRTIRPYWQNRRLQHIFFEMWLKRFWHLSGVLGSPCLIAQVEIRRMIAFDSLQSAGKLVGVIDKDTNTVEIQIDQWSTLIVSLATNFNKIPRAPPLTWCSKQPLSSPPLTWRQGWSRSEQQWDYVDKLTSLWLRDGSGLQNTWIFGQVPKGGGHFQSKNLYSRFWTFNI